MSTPPPATAQVEAPPPQEQQLLCPLCDYDLRAQVEPRCPECGYTFDFDELRDPTRRLHKYLFEHHPERNIGAFVQTMLAGWQPRKFWRTLYPAQRSDLRRLVIYQLVVTAVCLLLPVAVFVLMFTYQSSWRAQTSSAWEAIRRFDPPGQVLLVWLQLTLWPWLTFAALMVFQATIRRARIKPIHLLRCAVYCSDVVAVAAIAMLVAIAFEHYHHGGGWVWQSDGFIRQMAGWVLFLVPVIVAWRLAVACRQYLRIEKAVLVALITQFMLAMLTLKFALDEHVVDVVFLFD